MKIRSKEVKTCDTKDGWKTKVLEVNYTHKWYSGKILIKDYLEEDEKNVLKQLTAKVKEAYKNKDKKFELDETKEIIEIE